jgi:hypothetical protein
MKKQIIFLSAVLLVSTSMYAMEPDLGGEEVVISDAARRAKAAVVLAIASGKDDSGAGDKKLVTTSPVVSNTDHELLTAAIGTSISDEKKGTCKEWCEWAASLITGDKKKAE